MFVAGLETDLAEMRRVGKVAFWAAFGGVALPMAGGIATAVLFGLPLSWEAIFIGTILTATSVSISAQTLMELGALRSQEGATILGAAVIDDVMGIIVLSFVVAFARASAGGVDVAAVVLVVVRMAAYFVVAVVAGRWLAPALRWAGRLPVTQARAVGRHRDRVGLRVGGGIRRRRGGDHRRVRRRRAGGADTFQDSRSTPASIR